VYWLAVVIFFSFGGFSLSLCFCGVREYDRRLFLLFYLGSVSTQSGEDGGSGGGWGGWGGSGVVVK